MVLLSKDLGMAVGEYAFLFFYSIPGDPMLGDYSWRRGDDMDLVKRNLQNQCKNNISCDM